NPQTITITSDAYLGSPQAVEVRCKIADTTLQIMPTMFDFGEVRVAATAPSIPITLTNPASSAGAAMITAFDLRLHKNGLTLTKPAVPFSIAAGTVANASLSVSTTEDTDLTGEYLDITVDGSTLSFPVTGKVVHPHAYVTPTNMLDLGTACVGTQISGDVVMTNDGTATLFVMPPVMTPSFVAAAPATPGPLPPGMSRTATVTPAMSAMGPIEGTLSWTEDTPMTHEVGVKLDYVATGTALSPRGLDFGIVPVDDDPLTEYTQHLTLQNCDQAPTSIKIESLKTKAGTLGAWHLVPNVGYTKQLGAKETQAVQVTFDPPARGKYEADMTVQTSSGKQVVHLIGDATGRDFDNTSFYACACNGPGAPSRGWPIVLAVAIVIVRRRRPGPSSPR
ncbi:MAG TPA: choice-of-anchor D domain-containing protein, partial [Kofleriaceae bacterium]|nr:choice-of-anchor D domain-containing protein [Kofleriaceae bacterium]